jgi:hypothetical protein
MASLSFEPQWGKSVEPTLGLVTRYYFLSECFCLKFAVLFLWSALSDDRTVCSLQCNHSTVRVAQNPQRYFTVSSETPPTLKARFPYLYPLGTVRPSYTPGHWVPFVSPLTTRRATLEVWKYPNPPPHGDCVSN